MATPLLDDLKRIDGPEAGRGAAMAQAVNGEQARSGVRADQIDPTLTAAQIARIAGHGRRRRVAPGEVLVQAGERTARLFVVASGRIDVVRPSAAGEEVLVSFGPGMFTGEVTMLSGRRGLAQLQVGAVGEVIEVGRDDLLALIQQTDADLSEILMRAFILRR